MIVLYNPRSTGSSRKPPPLSLLAVASTLVPGREVAIVDGNVEEDPVGRIAELARRRRPEALGVTVMPGPQLERALPDTRRLRSLLPGTPIVWGGYFPSQHAATVLADGAVDFCVVGQGEETLPELLAVLESGGDLGEVPGLAWRDGGRPRVNRWREPVELDPLPDWPYHLVEMERYIQSHYLGRRVGAHQTSYGCPFGCGFCAIVPIARRRWRAQSPRRVAAVLELQRERWGIDAVQFHDMDFFIHEERTAEIADRIAPLGLAWWALGRVDELVRYRESTWRKMAASGLKMAFCGAETGSAETLRRMNKGGTSGPEKTVELVRRMRRHGVVPELSFVLGNPPDPEADVEATIALVRRLKEIHPATEVILYMYTPAPVDGTLSEAARAAGFEYPESLDEWVEGSWRRFALRRDPANPWLDDRLRRRVRDFEAVLNARYPTVTDASLSGLKARALRALGRWRYRTRFYAAPLELHLFQRLFRYRRPETAGF